MARITDLDLVAQAIASQRSALLAYGDDLTLAQCREINDTSGFTFERYVAPDRTLRVSEYHLADGELERAYHRSKISSDSDRSRPRTTGGETRWQRSCSNTLIRTSLP